MSTTSPATCVSLAWMAVRARFVLRPTSALASLRLRARLSTPDRLRGFRPPSPRPYPVRLASLPGLLSRRGTVCRGVAVLQPHPLHLVLRRHQSLLGTQLPETHRVLRLLLLLTLGASLSLSGSRCPTPRRGATIMLRSSALLGFLICACALCGTAARKLHVFPAAPLRPCFRPKKSSPRRIVVPSLD